MHPGNLFVDPTGASSRSISASWAGSAMKERRFLAEILLGFIRRDYRRVAEVHFEAGYVPPHHSVEDFAQAIRAIGEPIHDRRADEISMAKLLTLLFEITGLFDMATRTELVMLQKTMVVVEGVARNLDPRLDMWTTSEPVVREWIERHLGPVGRIEEAGRGSVDARRRRRRPAGAGLAGGARAEPARGRDRQGRLRSTRQRRRHRPGGSGATAGASAALWIIAASLMIMADERF